MRSGIQVSNVDGSVSDEANEEIGDPTADNDDMAAAKNTEREGRKKDDSKSFVLPRLEDAYIDDGITARDIVATPDIILESRERLRLDLASANLTIEKLKADAAKRVAAHRKEVCTVAKEAILKVKDYVYSNEHGDGAAATKDSCYNELQDFLQRNLGPDSPSPVANHETPTKKRKHK